MRGLVWLRADLRISDNSALYNASLECTDGVVVLHCVTKTPNLQAHFNSRQQTLLQKQLTYLQTALAALNIPFLVKVVDSMDNMDTEILQLMQQHQLDTLYYNSRYDLAQRTHDRHLTQTLLQANLKVKTYVDHLIAPPGELLTPKDKPFTSFSAFKKAWQGFLRHAHIHPQQVLKQTQRIALNEEIQVLDAHHPVNTSLAFDEPSALAMLQRESDAVWDILDAQNYAKHTQHLHALFTYLTIGLLSPRQFIQMLLQGEHLQNKQEVDKWLTLMIDREFNQHIMYHFPHICSGHDFNPHMDLHWQKDPKLLLAWQQGQTGYPLIDAAMRCLNQTGYLVEDLLQASSLFFTKVLFMDYRLGEQYFAQMRLDYDFASNNALWQWSASTGAESVLYSRIPQPARQSEVFDSNGEFIRTFCPELAKINAIGIHDPHVHAAHLVLDSGYPQPIVDYTQMRKKTLYHFKSLNKSLKAVDAV